MKTRVIFVDGLYKTDPCVGISSLDGDEIIIPNRSAGLRRIRLEHRLLDAHHGDWRNDILGNTPGLPAYSRTNDSQDAPVDRSIASLDIDSKKNAGFGLPAVGDESGNGVSAAGGMRARRCPKAIFSNTKSRSGPPAKGFGGSRFIRGKNVRPNRVYVGFHAWPHGFLAVFAMTGLHALDVLEHQSPVHVQLPRVGPGVQVVGNRAKPLMQSRNDQRGVSYFLKPFHCSQGALR